MYGKALYAIAVVIVITLGASFFVFQSSRTDGKTYKNSVNNFELTYPSDLDIKEYDDDMATIGVVSKDAVDGKADIRVITAQGEAGQTMEDAVADQLKNLCAADGPESSLSCTTTLSTEPFATEAGDEGFILMLNGELKQIKSGTVESVPHGPYYVLPLATSATISKVLVIMPPLNRSAAEADGDLIQAIARSVYFRK
jgi:hypothetical protein